MESNEKQISHNGWENYYANAKQVAWKDAPEEFLTANKDVLRANKKYLTIFDIACGDGRNTTVWANIGNVICCNDISDTALKAIQKLEIPNSLILLGGDFMDLNLLHNQFDVIQCFDGLPQMSNVRAALIKMIELLKPGGMLTFNMFTPNDVAFGKGTQISPNSFNYKDTLFSFFTLNEVIAILPTNVSIEKYETKKWVDPPHGEFRPYTHTHEAIFFIINKSN